MINFLNNITTFLNVLPRMASEELRSFRNSFLWLVGFLYAICIFQLITDSYVLSSIFGFILSVLSAITLFRIRRITSITITGEAAEILRITPRNNHDQGAAAAVINPLSTMFWNVSLQVFFFAIVAFLIVPVIPFRNDPLFIVLFPTIAVAVAIAFKGTALRVVNWISSVAILGLIVFHIVLFIPQIGVQKELGDGIIPSSTAKRLSKIDDMASDQIEDIINKDTATVDTWVKKNPGKALPEQYQIFIDNVSRGKMIPLADMKKKSVYCFLSIPAASSKIYELEKGDYELNKTMLVIVEDDWNKKSKKTDKFSVSHKQFVRIGYEAVSGVFEDNLYQVTDY